MIDEWVTRLMETLKNRLVKPWMRPSRPGEVQEVAAPAASGPARPRFPVSREYLPLHKYLDNRFANVVVLTFGQIEDLLGFPLPQGARAEPGWWARSASETTPSVQWCSWSQASRTAKANLMAQTVVFERT